MKLVTYQSAGIKRIGSVHNEQIIDLNYAYRSMLEADGSLRSEQIAEAFVPPHMVEFLKGGEQSMRAAKEAAAYALSHAESLSYQVFHNVNEVKIEAPVTTPGKIICVGHNYREHILEMGRELPTIPVVFAKFGNTVVGPQDDIPFYPVSDQLDYEAEFAFVIGKRARCVSEADALQYVAGYTVANDVTYRDLQRRTIEWLQGKTVEGSAPMGPWLVTADELGNPAGLDISLTVNGERRQHSNTANLVFTVPFLIQFLSNLMTLEPGDIVLTGTPGGVGVAREPQAFLKEGDVVRVEIENIGALENRVVRVNEGVRG
ncbi:fumarylacetoacetate hydrolase family protein [Paenibacillus thalictri]|uniref:FAA hydrolase family protein n=1 Tax=Paenibacillus thalictri TaxID=2527873 RepID=A0A4V2J489_9BACL|nr:fumarylacetoacetate hydrolase family protein [Paenibacillus thalictri]TBL78541.1 FAA hydrolase family protein [Paenibacillus thalictri]